MGDFVIKIVFGLFGRGPLSFNLVEKLSKLGFFADKLFVSEFESIVNKPTPNKKLDNMLAAQSQLICSSYTAQSQLSHRSVYPSSVQVHLQLIRNSFSTHLQLTCSFTHVKWSFTLKNVDLH